MAINVLALDPGARCGACWGPAGGSPKSTAIRLDSKMSHQRKLTILEDRIRNIIATHEIEGVAYEGQHAVMPKAGKENRFNFDSIIKQAQWAGAIITACEREGIGAERVKVISPDAWRKSAFGEGKTKAPKNVEGWKERREYMKGEAYLECARRGWPVQSEDEAESALLWSHACELFAPMSTLNLLPLFELCHIGN